MQNVLPRSGARAYTVSDDASADQRYINIMWKHKRKLPAVRNYSRPRPYMSFEKSKVIIQLVTPSLIYLVFCMMNKGS